MKRGIQIEKQDDVIVVLEAVQAGDWIEWSIPGGGASMVQANEDVDIYHKLAVRDIPEGAPVHKYGERIGIAVRKIEKGDHVHVQNMRSAVKGEEDLG